MQDFFQPSTVSYKSKAPVEGVPPLGAAHGFHARRLRAAWFRPHLPRLREDCRQRCDDGNEDGHGHGGQFRWRIYQKPWKTMFFQVCLCWRNLGFLRKRWEKNLFVFFRWLPWCFWDLMWFLPWLIHKEASYGSQYIRLSLASLATMMNWWICSKIEVGQRLQFGILAAGLAQSWSIL